MVDSINSIMPVALFCVYIIYACPATFAGSEQHCAVSYINKVIHMMCTNNNQNCKH